MKRLIFVIIAVLAIAATSRAQQTFIPACAGTNDTAAFQTIITNAAGAARTITVPYKSNTNQRCALNTITIPSNITIDNTNGSGVKVNSGQTVTVNGPYVNPIGKTLFYGPGSTTINGQGYGSSGAGAVLSVHGRTGAVTAATNDYTWAQIDKSTSSLADLATRSASDLNSGTVPSARGGAGTVNGILKANGSGSVSAASAGTDYQAAGNYITALTGDVTASGPGSAVATLANSGVSANTYTNATITVNAKGIITSASSGTGVGNPLTLGTSSGTLIGGTATTATLTLQATSGVGTTGADVVIKSGNNGGTELARFKLQSVVPGPYTIPGSVGIGIADPVVNDDVPAKFFTVSGEGTDPANAYTGPYIAINNIHTGSGTRTGGLIFTHSAWAGVDKRTAGIFALQEGADGQGNLQFWTGADIGGPLAAMYIDHLQQVGIGTNPGGGFAAKFSIRGSGSTSSTYAMSIENSGGGATLRIRDDGVFAMGDNLDVRLSAANGIQFAPATVLSAGINYASGILEINNGNTGTRDNLRLQGLQYTTGSRPTCDVAHRGFTWYVAGGAGVLDTLEVCRKDAGDSYAWVSLF